MQLSCDDCPTMFKNASAKSSHKLSVHDGIIYRCEKCDYTNIRKQALSEHILAKHEGRVFNCDKCNKKFRYKDTLTRHQNFKHGGQCPECRLCGVKAKGPSELKIHIKIVHEGFRYKCEKCPVEYKQSENLNEHIKTIHEGHRYKCGECLEEFTKLSDIKRHKQTHKHTNLYCQECTFEAENENRLKKHVASVHTKFSGKCPACSQCGLKVLNVRILKEHIKVRHEGARYNCDKCTTTFSTNRALKKHKQKHNGKNIIAKTKDRYKCHENRHLNAGNTMIDNDSDSSVEASCDTKKGTAEDDLKVISDNVVEEIVTKVQPPSYLCPVSDCVYTCPTLQQESASQHLQSSHGYSNSEKYKFIKL